MANFDLAIPKILENEGGYQSSEADRGNYNSRSELVGTNWGISAPTFEKWRGSPPTANDMRNMSKSTAIAIYKKYYWDAYNIGFINDQYLANHVFDIYVNSSPRSAASIIQRAINGVPPFYELVDGVMGPSTRGTINKIVESGKASELNNAIVSERKKYYASLGSDSFGSGWQNRADVWLNYVAYPATLQAGGYGFAFLLLIGVYLMNKK